MIEKVLVEPKKDVPMRGFSNELEQAIGQLHEAITGLNDAMIPCLTPELEIKPGPGKPENAPVPPFSPLEIWLRERIAEVQKAKRKINDLQERCSL